MGHRIGDVRIQKTILEKWMKAVESQEVEDPGKLEGTKGHIAQVFLCPGLF